MILVNQRVKSNCFKYQGDECIFAKVQGGISSENPVIVGPKFFHAAVKGYDSQVSTLCHEFSHLSEVLYTDDLSLRVKMRKQHLLKNTESMRKIL